MKRLVALFCGFLAVPALAQDDSEEAYKGSYRCRLQLGAARSLDISQTLSVSGKVQETSASWIQPKGLYNRKRPEDRDIADPSYMTVSVNSRRSPAAEDPAWFDMAGAKVQITVVTRGRMRRATHIIFRRPSRTGERYEDGLHVVATNSRHLPWSIVALPYRVFRAFADGEPLLSWTLVRWVGGDSAWEQVEEGEFDLGKVEAFAAAVQAERPALDALRADYRNRCRFDPAASITDDEGN